jgi:hypothetical protein
LKFIQVPVERRIGLPAGLEDFQQGWFVNLLCASLEAELQGFLPMSSNLWSIAGAKRKDFWESHKSRLLACFEVREMVDGKKLLFYPPLVALIEEGIRKINEKRRRFNPAFSEDSTDVHKGCGDLSPSLSDFDVGSKKERKQSKNERTGFSKRAQKLEQTSAVLRESLRRYDR